MQNRLLVFKPAIVSRRESLFLTEEMRDILVGLSHAYSETVRFKLPEGFEVDELPDRAQASYAVGSHATRRMS